MTAAPRGTAAARVVVAATTYLRQRLRLPGGEDTLKRGESR